MKIKGMVVNVATKNETNAETNDRIYLGIMGTGGGGEFPLDIPNFTEFPRGGKVKFRFGDVWDTAALTGAKAAVDADGNNDPEGRCVELDQVQYVYIRKASNKEGTLDDEWKMDEVEVTLYGASPQKRTFLKKEDSWLANEYGLQLWLKEKKPYLYLTQGASNSVSAIDITTTPPTTAETVQVGTQPAFLVVSPSKARVYVANKGSQSLTVINATTSPLSVAATLPLGAEPYAIAVHPNGSRVFVTCGPRTAGSVKVINVSVTPPAVLATVPVQGYLFGALAVSPDGERLFVTGGPQSGASNDSVTVFDISGATPTLVGSVEGQNDTPEFVYLNPGGTLAYVSYRHGGINVIDALATPPVMIANAGSGEVNGSALSPDGNRLLMGYAEPVGGSGHYAIYDTSDTPPTDAYFFNRSCAPGPMVFSDDGARVYMSSQNQLVVFDMTAIPPAIAANMPIAVPATGIDL